MNPLVDVDKCPLATAEDIFATLVEGQHSKLDLCHVYNQLECNDDFKYLLIINTHRGLYQSNHLHYDYGVNSAPAIFQRKMD